MVDTQVMQHHSCNDYFTTSFRTITESPSCFIHAPPTTLPNTESTHNGLANFKESTIIPSLPRCSWRTVELQLVAL